MAAPSTYSPANPESVFTYGAPQLKFGTGASDEIGYDLSQTGAKRVLVVTAREDLEIRRQVLEVLAG